MREPKTWTDRKARAIAVNELIETLENWDGVAPALAALVTESMATSTGLGYGDLLSTELSREFEEAHVKVDRLVNGVARPHPKIARMIVASIARRLRHQLEDAERIEKK